MFKSTKNPHIAIKNGIPLDLSLQKTLKDAVIKRDYTSVKQLLKNGVNPNEQDTEGFTALHFAAMDNRIFIASLLLQKGAYIMIKNNAGYTALDYALRFNYESLKNLFLKKLKNVNDRNFCSFFAYSSTFSAETQDFKTHINQLNYCR